MQSTKYVEPVKVTQLPGDNARAANKNREDVPLLAMLMLQLLPLKRLRCSYYITISMPNEAYLNQSPAAAVNRDAAVDVVRYRGRGWQQRVECCKVHEVVWRVALLSKTTSHVTTRIVNVRFSCSCAHTTA